MRVVCADVGSTFTKVAVVDLADGAVLGRASHRTTVDTDVLHGLDAAIEAAGGAGLPVYACSSAGGGLRLAVVGYERLVTAEAGHRVGLSAGARVVHVAAGRLDAGGVRALRAARPDVVLLVGGTDGGEAEVLVHNAARLARLRTPVVAAGNADARDQVAALLPGAVLAENVLPRIGVLRPEPARAAIREVFLRHVIGGKRLSRGRRFPGLVRGATPDLVLTGVERLAERLGAEVAVVDVGGATTDVYSILTPDGRPAADVAGTLWHARTVEGDLGMRWTAPGVVEAAGATDLAEAAAARAADPAFVPATPEDEDADARIATHAAVTALRRHAKGVRDLRGVRLLVGSGGVLRHARGGRAERVLDAVLADHEGGWALPRGAARVIDREYVLAPAGLLAADHPAAADALLDRYLLGVRHAKYDTPAPAETEAPGVDTYPS